MSHTPIAPLGGSPAEDTFKVYTLKSDVRFLSKAVQPPSVVYVDPNDVMQVGCATSQTNEAVTVSYRLLRADGELILGQFQLFPPNTRVVTSRQEPLAEGFLLSVSCNAAVATTRGQTFVRVFLTDQSLGAGQPSYMLMADYVTNAMAPAYPNGRILAPSEGPGWAHSIQVPNPLPQHVWTQFVPTNARWAVRSCFFNLTTDATAINRSIGLQLSSGGFLIYNGFSPSTVGPSVTVSYAGAQMTPHVTSNPTALLVPLPPDVVLLSIGEISSAATPFGVGDQFTNIIIQIEEWLDNV